MLSVMKLENQMEGSVESQMEIVVIHIIYIYIYSTIKASQHWCPLSGRFL